jgi:glutaconate CoA-transferase subunit B
MMNAATLYESMAVAIAKELHDEETWFTGLATGGTTVQILARLPLVAMALARMTHAPNSFMLVSGWLSNPVLSEIPTGMETEFGTSMHFWRSECRGGTHVMGRGDIDVGFGSAAQVDQYGNCNIVCIGDYHKPKVRLIGPINQPGHFSQFGREIIILDHDPRNFVDRVDFVSGAGFLDGPGARQRAGLTEGGPCLVLTDKAIFDFHPETKRIRLKSIHPGIRLEDVKNSTRFSHDWAPSDVPTTPTPSAEELRLIREVIDPRGVLLPR